MFLLIFFCCLLVFCYVDILKVYDEYHFTLTAGDFRLAKRTFKVTMDEIKDRWYKPGADISEHLASPQATHDVVVDKY